MFLSYEPSCQPDAELAAYIQAELGQETTIMLSSRPIGAGSDRRERLERQLTNCDVMATLLSDVSMWSSELLDEVKVANTQFVNSGRKRPKIVPIYIADQRGLPGDQRQVPEHLREYLKGTSSLSWNGMQDNVQLAQSIRDVLLNRDPGGIPPSPHKDPFVLSLKEPRGAVRESRFYIERESDQLLHNELRKTYGATITIRGIRQTGKTSLLSHAIQQARDQGTTVAYMDFQGLNASSLVDMETLLHTFALLIVDRLTLSEDRANQQWQSQLPPAQRVTNLIEQYVFAEFPGRVMIAIDEVDLLLRMPYYNDFFALLRSWHNNRAMSQIWERLDLVLVISTDPHLLISDLNQSPFNVGTRIALEDFSLEQVRDLSFRYRAPASAGDMARIHTFLNGHPYLTSQALYMMRRENLVWDKVLAVATTETSPFIDHLQHYERILKEQPRLRQAMKQVIRKGTCTDEPAYYRLLKAGLIKGTPKQCTCRCELYSRYFRVRL
jgi:hypothetical protein